MEKLQGIGLIILAIIAAWLVFRVVKKIVLAIITILILGAVALFVYLKYF